MKRPAWICALALIAALAPPASAQTTRIATETVAVFEAPWAVAPLPGGGFLVTEKAGRLVLVGAEGDRRRVAGVPAVRAAGQTGLHDVALAPDFAQSGLVYLTWVAGPDGGALHLGRARLDRAASPPRLEGFETLWRADPSGGRGHPGAIIAFGPDGHLFLTSGDRQLGDPAQVLDDARGKILRLTAEGRPAPGNPFPEAPAVWTHGHRNPYGLAFDAAGRLWSHEMGPRGGDELNLIAPGANYGWPAVSEGRHYSGWPIPGHDSRADVVAPVLHWTPVIAPAGMIIYDGAAFPDWRGSALIGGLRAEALVRVRLSDGQSPGDTPARAQEVERLPLGARIRDVAADAAGAVYVLEDGPRARLLRLTPEK